MGVLYGYEKRDTKDAGTRFATAIMRLKSLTHLNYVY